MNKYKPDKVIQSKTISRLEDIYEYLDNLDIPEGSTDDELSDIRNLIIKGRSKMNNLLKQTNTEDKFKDITEEDIKEYILSIITNTINLQETPLSYDLKFEGIQDVKLNYLIKSLVASSELGIKKFKIKHLFPIRSRVEQSKTLRELRVECKLLVSQLKYYYENNDLKEVIEYLTNENDNLVHKLEERERILSEILGVYDESLEEIELLKQMENTKKQMNISDEQVCKIYSISRSKLNSMRKMLK